jgi:hypothetical protein
LVSPPPFVQHRAGDGAPGTAASAALDMFQQPPFEGFGLGVVVGGAFEQFTP